MSSKPTSSPSGKLPYYQNSAVKHCHPTLNVLARANFAVPVVGIVVVIVAPVLGTKACLHPPRSRDIQDQHPSVILSLVWISQEMSYLAVAGRPSRHLPPSAAPSFPKRSPVSCSATSEIQNHSQKVPEVNLV